MLTKADKQWIERKLVQHLQAMQRILDAMILAEARTKLLTEFSQERRPDALRA